MPVCHQIHLVALALSPNHMEPASAGLLYHPSARSRSRAEARSDHRHEARFPPRERGGKSESQLKLAGCRRGEPPQVRTRSAFPCQKPCTAPVAEVAKTSVVGQLAKLSAGRYRHRASSRHHMSRPQLVPFVNIL